MPTEISGSTGVNKIQDNTIVNADINSSAAIAGSKLVMPTGSVLQVIQDTHSAEQNTTSTSFIDASLSATITPSSASNKILVLVEITGVGKMGASNNSGVSLKLVRNNSNVNTFADRAGYNATGNSYNWIGSIGHNYLDTPNSTSALTYKIQYRSKIDGSTARINDNNNVSSLILMEIAG